MPTVCVWGERGGWPIAVLAEWAWPKPSNMGIVGDLAPRCGGGDLAAGCGDGALVDSCVG